MGTQEDLELLKAVRDWRPPDELHPSAMLAWGLYEKNGMKMPAEAMQILHEGLDNYGEDLIGLAEALEGITRFVLLMKQRGDHETSNKVAALLTKHAHRFEPFWARVADAVENVGDESRGLFYAFVDQNRDAEKTAPKFGDKPPPETTPLKELTPPARPPPWVKDDKK